MIELIKHIWSGPWTVKASFIFLILLLVPFLIASPGRVILTGLILFSIFRLLSWIFDNE